MNKPTVPLPTDEAGHTPHCGSEIPAAQRQGFDVYSESVPCSFAAHHGDSMSVRTSILPRQADELKSTASEGSLPAASTAHTSNPLETCPQTRVCCCTASLDGLGCKLDAQGWRLWPHTRRSCCTTSLHAQTGRELPSPGATGHGSSHPAGAGRWTQREGGPSLCDLAGAASCLAGLPVPARAPERNRPRAFDCAHLPEGGARLPSTGCKRQSS